MQYTELKYVKLPVSRVVLGTSIAPFLHGQDCSGILSAALDCGINTIDTARVYGRSENVIGDWLQASGKREEVVILSKGCHPGLLWQKRISVKALHYDIQKSLSALKTDRIDIYLLHRDNPRVPVGILVEELNALHAKGTIGAFGGSNWTERRLEEANEYAYSHNLVPFTASSPNYSLAEQYRVVLGGGVTISGKKGASERGFYAKSGIAVFAYSSLARGFLSGRIKSADCLAGRLHGVPREFRGKENYIRLSRCEELASAKGVTVAQIALAYILSQKMNAFAVVASVKPSRLAQNAAAADIKLTAEELDYLDLLS